MFCLRGLFFFLEREEIRKSVGGGGVCEGRCWFFLVFLFLFLFFFVFVFVFLNYCFFEKGGGERGSCWNVSNLGNDEKEG